MPVIKSAKGEKPSKKLGEKEEFKNYIHDQNQKLELANRQKELELISPDRDIRLLRIKYDKLENSQGTRPILKQNVSDHVKTLYEQEAKYLGERAELYQTSYDPYKLGAHVVSNKSDNQPVTIGGYSNKKDVVIPGDSYEHRPKLFADKVFNDHKNNREALEANLLDPRISAQPVRQENGFILKQSVYGDTFNTKKYLQENEFSTQRLTEPLYVSKDAAELDYQDIALKSKADELALNDYKAGITDNPKDVFRAQFVIDEVERYEKSLRNNQYPRLSGPLNDPYEPIYNTTEICETSDGFKNRETLRVYDSPYSSAKPTYEALHVDLKTLAEIEQKKKEHEARVAQELANEKQNSDQNDATIKDYSRDRVARRHNDPIRSQFPISVYQNNYSKIEFVHEEKCAPNDYYERIHYTDMKEPVYKKPHASRFIELRDKWSKTSAQQKFLNHYSTPTVDLRQNIKTGKKQILASPIVAARNAIVKKV